MAASVARFNERDIESWEREAGMPLREKHREPTTQLVAKDESLPSEDMLDLNPAQVKNARLKELMPTMTIRCLEDGPDRTNDQWTNFAHEFTIAGMSAQNTIYDLQMAIANQENMDFEDVNLFIHTDRIPGHWRIGDCHDPAPHSTMAPWPPKFVNKKRVNGFEVFVFLHAGRDTQEWEGGRCKTYMDRDMIFDVEPTTTVWELKSYITRRVMIPEGRQSLSACLRRDIRDDCGEWIDLDDNSKTLADYEIDQYQVYMNVCKSACDENGMYIFDDAYWDDQGYVPQPDGCWLHVDSLSDRSRPDAHKVDPNQPLTILTDNNAIKAARAAEIERKKRMKEGLVDEEEEDWGDWQE